MSYNFEVKYKEGRKLNNADALSRMRHGDAAVDDPCLPRDEEMVVCAIGSEVCSDEEMLRMLQGNSWDSSLTTDKICEETNWRRVCGLSGEMCQRRR